jgi:hypothetical protein
MGWGGRLGQGPRSGGKSLVLFDRIENPHVLHGVKGLGPTGSAVTGDHPKAPKKPHWRLVIGDTSPRSRGALLGGAE